MILAVRAFKLLLYYSCQTIVHNFEREHNYERVCDQVESNYKSSRLFQYRSGFDKIGNTNGMSRIEIKTADDKFTSKQRVSCFQQCACCKAETTIDVTIYLWAKKKKRIISALLTFK